MNKRQESLLLHFVFFKEYKMSEIIHLGVGTGDNVSLVSLATTKRDLNFLADEGYIKKIGEKRNLKYLLSDFGLLHRNFNLEEYSKKEEYKRKAIAKYNFQILDVLGKEEIFTADELKKLNEATKEFTEKAKEKSETIHKKELERFIIELSWKSSKIEGNTYTLLDTEKLLKEGIESPNNTKEEAVMILNHKKAFMYLLECKNLQKDIVSFRELENIHRILVEGLGVNHGLRKSAVGITGTNYLPLALPSQIEEETKKLVEVLHAKTDVFSKSLLSILGISYIQPFEDGNKRTARLFSNAILINNNCAPLSYRGVDEKEYREAMLVFYEQNSLEAFKKIFIEQYVFACENYNLS
jgi:Fic family protein